MNTALSIDESLYEKEDGSVVTLADVVADKQQGEQTEYVISKGHADVEDDDYWRSVNEYMKRCFAKYGTEIGATIMSYMLDHDCGFRDAIVALYGEDVYNDRKQRSKYEYHKKQTQFQFKRNWNTDAAKEERRKLMLDERTIGLNGLRDSGFKCFSQSGMSSVERSVLLRNR